MKRLAAALLALCLAACTVCALAEDAFDLSYVRERPGFYTIDLDEDAEAAFIESTLSVQDRSYVHAHESDYRYSDTLFDILVLNYGKDDVYPVFRLWVTYSADEFAYVDSVTFAFGGREYTFTGISDDDWMLSDEKGCMEQVLIKFDPNNIEFCIALENYAGNDSGALADRPVEMTLHCRNEDITVTLGSGFLQDFIILKNAMVNTNGLAFLDMAYGSAMTVR